MVTQSELLALMRYDPDTGVFTRAVTRGKWRAGTCCGSAMETGYVSVGINYRRYLAHRLAWLYMTGRWPAHEIDHVNGVRDDNRWCNLREATRSDNAMNTRGRSKSGYKNVVLHAGGKFYARIQRGTLFIAGPFDTHNEANAAAIAMRDRLAGAFANGHHVNASTSIEHME